MNKYEDIIRAFLDAREEAIAQLVESGADLKDLEFLDDPTDGLLLLHAPSGTALKFVSEFDPVTQNIKCEAQTVSDTVLSRHGISPKLSA